MAIQQLILPTRYEKLRESAEQENADISRIVEPVQAANQHVQGLFLRMSQTRVSRFEVIVGESGSGKTTFLETLPIFFDNVQLVMIPPTVPLIDAVAWIAKIVNSGKKEYVVVYFGGTGRDNPIETDEQFFPFFERLRGYFREAPKPVLVVWPVSRYEPAKRLYDLARNVGADSLVGESSGPYRFPGPDKAKARVYRLRSFLLR